MHVELETVQTPSTESEASVSSGLGPQANQEATPTTFAALGADERMVTALSGMGFTKPFPIQIQSFGPVSQGKDLIVQAKTGSGKTAAFGVPLVQARLLTTQPVAEGRPQALVLVPTRELALQVAKQLERFAEGRGVTVVTLYGGAPIQKQISQLAQGAHIVVGTPGRILDHIRRKTLQLGQVRSVVLDEADEMFSRGFLEDIRAILKECPEEKQMLLFSATLPDPIKSVIESAMRAPEIIQLAGEESSPAEIDHYFYMISGMARTRDLLRVLDVEQPACAVIFCNTKVETEEVASFLRSNGLHAQAISSNLTQSAREQVMELMRERKLAFLVATDIAARGIDISHITHVIHYTFPESPEVYIHRTGRTGRAGNKGVAISLIGPRELGSFYTFKLSYKIRPEEKTLPPAEDLQLLRAGQCVGRLQQEIVRVPQPLFFEVARSIASHPEGERWIAVLLEQYLTAPRFELEEEKDEEHAVPREAQRTERSRGRGHRSEAGSEGARRTPDRPERSRRERPPSGNAERSEEKPRRERSDKRTERPRRIPRDSLSSARTSTPAAPANWNISTDLIDTQGGTEYWEAWVDSRSTGAPSTPLSQSGASEMTTDTSSDLKPPSDSDRKEKQNRRRRTSRKSNGVRPPEGAIKLYLNLGGRHGFELEQLEQLCQQHGLPVPPAQVHGTHTYLFVSPEQVEQVIGTLHGKPFGNRTVVCEQARERPAKTEVTVSASESAPDPASHSTTE